MKNKIIFFDRTKLYNKKKKISVQFHNNILLIINLKLNLGSTLLLTGNIKPILNQEFVLGNYFYFNFIINLAW